MKKKLFILIPFFIAAGFFSIGCLTVYADFDLARWKYRAPIKGVAGIGSDYVTLDIPSGLFSYLKSDLSDLRVVNDDGEVPYVAAVEREIQSVSSIPARMFNLSTIPGDNTSFMVNLGQSGIFHNSVSVRTSSENFRRMVEVSGSDDASSWRVLNFKGQIFDYTVRDISPVSVEYLSVPYPESTFRYLLVTIRDNGEAPLKIQGAEVRREVKLAAREISYAPAMEISENAKDRATEIWLDLGARGIPHRMARLEISDTNFSRAVAIFESDDKKEWRALGYAYIFSIDTPKFYGKQLEFTYPESNKQYLKFAILNRDDRPLSVSKVSLSGVMRRILFSFNPSRNYYLYAGNPNARRPQYDIEAISQYVDSTTLNKVGAGATEKNLDFEPIKPPLSERSPYVLPVTLGLMVLALAALLLRLFMKFKNPTNDIK